MFKFLNNNQIVIQSVLQSLIILFMYNIKSYILVNLYIDKKNY